MLARLCAHPPAEMMGPMRLPWIAAAGISLLLVSGGLLDALSGHGVGLATVVAWSAMALVSTGFGLVVATRRRRHPIGWLLLALSLIHI